MAQMWLCYVYEFVTLGTLINSLTSSSTNDDEDYLLIG